MTAAVETVRPSTAREWLTHNTRNRNWRPDRIVQYAHDMRVGNWHMTGEPIKFAYTGRLLDGQQRLMAVVDANVEVDFLVVRGLAENAQRHMDSGAARTAGDALRLDGYTNTAALAAAARHGFLHDTGQTFGIRRELIEPDSVEIAEEFEERGELFGIRQPRVSHADIIDWVVNHPAIVEASDFCVRNAIVRIPLPPSVKIYTFYLFAQIDQEQAEEFFDLLSLLTDRERLATENPKPLKKGSPVLALMSRLDKIREDNERVPTRELLALVLRAWNAWRENRSITTLPLHPRGAVPKALPDLV